MKNYPELGIQNIRRKQIRGENFIRIIVRTTNCTVDIMMCHQKFEQMTRKELIVEIVSLFARKEPAKAPYDR